MSDASPPRERKTDFLGRDAIFPLLLKMGLPAAVGMLVNALYNVVVLFDRGQNYSIMRVQGALRLYAAARDSTHGDQTLPYYQLRGQLDMTQNLAAAKDIESFAWGTVKAIFR